MQRFFIGKAPQFIEVFMGFLCLICMLANAWFKVQSKTLVFMLNPCHFSCLLLIYLCFTKESPTGQFIALSFYAFTFGGILGIIFTENEGLPMIDIVFYYIHHLLVGLIGPLVLSLCGRYDIRNYTQMELYLMAPCIFSFYMRWILTPVS